MKIRASRCVVVGVLSFPLILAQFLNAQNSNGTISGTVSNPAGQGIANAKLSIKNLNTGQAQTLETSPAGAYTLSDLAPADYEISVSADGYASTVQKITLIGGATEKVNAVLTSQASQSQENLPNAPSSSKTSPSIEDLGFPSAETQGNAKQQALLDKRTHYLKIHQRMGLITTIPLIATVITSAGAGGKSESSTDRTVHMVLGAVSSDLYFTTAYFAIRAPRVPGTETRGPIKFHKAMAWIHGPGMILTPILGAMAYSQKSNGEKVHGIAAAHGPVAIVTASAFGAALLSVSLKF
jgi:hypothetical protein